MSEVDLPYSLERNVLIRARRTVVFKYFTDSARWAAWWGAGSKIDPVPGGRVLIRYPNGHEAGGEVLAIEPTQRIAFSYGYASGEPFPLGASRVEIELTDDPAGTFLHLRHHLADAALRDHHVQGWRYQFAVFANVVADEVNAGAAEIVDAWLGAWSEPDASKRGALLAKTVRQEIRFRDRYSTIDGLADLEPHLAAVHAFMPGSRLEREGKVRHCQGTVLADWIAKGADGKEMGRGTNVFTLDPEGRLVEVVGVWS
jgi:uncharacterized protein YndB with AHSA1/START domain